MIFLTASAGWLYFKMNLSFIKGKATINLVIIQGLEKKEYDKDNEELDSVSQSYQQLYVKSQFPQNTF